ncbi:hypothetical protein OG252_02725 [Streptomyces sp. NBC_01352]|uniref:hypothetical protein n=1 Tax=Streptomyces sp. NBC_01352 TaxID=2903834 RepID=UPI002E364983|nr:hypothetical protein [Streptomyces sp. NBC_01352]
MGLQQQFGGGRQRADVVIEATTEDEAIAVMDTVLRAIRRIAQHRGPLGDGSPHVGKVREYYGITTG